VAVPAAGQAEETVAVTYSTPAFPPRIVNLGLDLYRPATLDELNANPRYHMLPVDERAAEAERQAIQTDMKAAIGRVPEHFELP
jgi:hypothetical protein